MSAAYDVVVIGGGHNGLVAAAYLARAGLRVIVLERRETLGGAAATEAVFPGFQVSTGAHDAHLLLPQVVRDLDLRRHGLEFVESPVLAAAPQPDGSTLTLWRDPAKTQTEIERYSRADAGRYPAFVQLTSRLIAALEDILTLTPPDLGDLAVGELLPWARVALGARRLGGRDMMELVRVLPMPAAELLDEHFESEALKGALAAGAVVGGPYGPLAAGTAFRLLYQRLGAAGGHRFVCGGLGRLAGALAAAARQHGAEIRTGAEVARLTLRDDGVLGAVTGVALASGETLQARAVVSSADPRRTLFGLVGAPNLEPRFVRQVRNVRYRGCTAKVHLALDGLPALAGHEGASERLSGHVLISPSLEYLERGADAAKYGRLSEEPLLDVVIPSLLDPTAAPAGQHLMSIVAQWAPYHLREGDWDTLRPVLEERVIDTLAQYMPGLRDRIVARHTLTPLDWERDYGLTEGGVDHGEMALDQLLIMRPMPGYARYRMPVAGLYLCGAGTHPGGGVTGAPGSNAAREVLKDLRR